MENETVHVYPNLDALSDAAAERLADRMARVLAERDRFTLALAGGNTPRLLYQRLASASLPWHQTHLYWSDERYVSHDASASNYRMVREALLDDITIPASNVHPMPTAPADPDEAASAYEATLCAAFPDATTFDLVLLGLGSDGHTASLFPDDARATIDDASVPWVRAVEAPPRYDVRTRLTLTLPTFNRARHVFFLVASAGKHEALDAVLQRRDRTLPPVHVHPHDQVVWFVDEAAFDGKNGEEKQVSG